MDASEALKEAIQEAKRSQSARLQGLIDARATLTEIEAAFHSAYPTRNTKKIEVRARKAKEIVDELLGLL